MWPSLAKQRYFKHMLLLSGVLLVYVHFMLSVILMVMHRRWPDMISKLVGMLNLRLELISTLVYSLVTVSGIIKRVIARLKVSSNKLMLVSTGGRIKMLWLRRITNSKMQKAIQLLS